MTALLAMSWGPASPNQPQQPRGSWPGPWSLVNNGHALPESFTVVMRPPPIVNVLSPNRSYLRKSSGTCVYIFGISATFSATNTDKILRCLSDSIKNEVMLHTHSHVNISMMPCAHSAARSSNVSARSQANSCTLGFKAQAQLQARHIESAIQLLKTEYNAIMASLQQASKPTPCDTSVRCLFSKGPSALNQTSFEAQFRLPPPSKSEIDYTSSSLSTEAEASKKKRALVDESGFTAIAISNLLTDSEHCPPSKLQCGNKRPRRE